MEKIQSKINIHSEEYKNHYTQYLKLIKELKEKLEKIKKGGGEDSVKKHKEKGKLLARERIEKLIDPNTPFLELSPLACIDQYNNEFPSAGMITGIGLIHNKETMIIVNDATVKGGTYIKETIKKHLRAQEIALENHLPCVYLVDSGGVFLPKQAEVFPDKENFGRIFYNQAQMSKAGIPQISVVMGLCTAGGAYIPAMSDQTIIVKNQGAIFIGGPPLVKAATGEIVTAEELGGGEIHTRVSGVADYLAENDEHALEICRSIFESIPKQKKYFLDLATIEEPEYNSDELYGIAPIDLKKPVDPREIIARIVDGSKFLEFKERYAPTLVTGFARIMGYPVGILANYGVLFSESSLKGAHFIELCAQKKIPILFLQNITGFIVGKDFEHKGIAKDGAKMVHAVSNVDVPKFTVIVGGSFGAGNYAMCGRAFQPRLLFLWPNARISVMGGEQAANVLIQIKEEQEKYKNRLFSEEEKQNLKREILKTYEYESSPYYSTSRLWDDGIIDPVDTRKILALGISISLNKAIPEPKYGIFRM
ncbi:MAG: carboxyl transferase domain-containing protein [Leptonema sp. (in: bacteria)]